MATDKDIVDDNNDEVVDDTTSQDDNSGPSNLSLSDEDFLKQPIPDFSAPVQTTPSADDHDLDDDADDSDKSVEDADNDKTDTAEVKDTPSATGGKDKAAAVTPPVDGKKAAVDPKTDTDKKSEENVPEVIDYKAQYDKILAPFNANGKMIQAKTPEDAIALMQMGANYNKKMAVLKPNLKLMKMLENNGLLDEGKLSFLIDLDKKNPEAISKLMKDSGIDPMDLGTDKASEYKPQTYTVDPREIDLDGVLDDLKESPTYQRTLEVVSTKWDKASKQVIADIPDVLKVINDHMANGIYDLINAEVERERTFGRLNGLNDIDAYRKVGDAMNSAGAFNHLAPQPAATAPAEVVVPPKPAKVEDPNLRNKKRAASSTKVVAPNSAPSDFNVLGLSDEEFLKQSTQRYK